MAVTPAPLGGLSPREFLRGYWQKRPLLIRSAIPGFTGLIDKRALFKLAGADEVEARLVQRAPGWRVRTAPLAHRDLSALPAKNWTLLVNGLNLHCPAADALLRRFAFASWARLDDVMVSYAVDGGGVGAHADSYDVFLVQGPGRRRWRLMPPSRRPFEMVKGAPLKLIAGFRPTEEMTLEAGDMLYVPPGWGHEGTSIGTCHTYSVGFRAPGALELSTAFLDFLHERGFDEAAYKDPDRSPSAHPAKIDDHLIEHAARALARIRWRRPDVEAFVGRFLSEPDRQAVFEAPNRPHTKPQFLRRLMSGRLRLDARTRMLFRANVLYVNGTALRLKGRQDSALKDLADQREVDGARLSSAHGRDLAYDWYRQGVVELEEKR